jgi:hypothetical protein
VTDDHGEEGHGDRVARFGAQGKRHPHTHDRSVP